LNVDTLVIVKSANDIAAIENENALVQAAPDHSRLLVVFTDHTDALAALTALLPLVQPAEKMQIGKHAAFLWCANGILDSKVGAALTGKSGRQTTTRNWATVLKIAAALRDDVV
jgi:uncharacterized protein (DUF1697 family)